MTHATTATRRAAVMARRVAVAFLAVLMVVLLPSEAWASTSNLSAPMPSDATVILSESATITAPGSGNFSLTLKTNKQGANSVWLELGCADGYWGAGGLWDSYGAASLASGVSTSYSNMNQWCGAHGNMDRIRFHECNVVSCGGGTQPIILTDLTLNGIVPTTCTALTAASVSYVGGVLAADVRWTGIPPAGGFRVFVPGLASGPGTGTPQLTVAGSTSVPGDYYGTATITLSGVTGTTGWRVESANSSSCYVTGQVNVTTQVVQGTTSSGSDASGNDCGLNPFCYITAALKGGFVPQQSSITQYQQLGAQVVNVVPFGYVSDALAGFSSMSAGCGQGCDSTLLTGLAFDLGDQLRAPDGNGGHLSDTLVHPFQNNAAMTFLTSQRQFLAVLAWLGVLGPLVSLVWTRLLPFSGGEGE